MAKQSPPKAAIVATIYGHLAAFHLPAIRLLQQLGYEVHAYARADHGKQAVEETGAICHELPFQRQPFASDNLRAFYRLTKSFAAEQFQIVHVHTPVAGIIGRWAARRAKVPVVIYTAHGFHFYQGAPLLYWLLYYPVEWWTARYTDYLITINEEDYHRAKRLPVRREARYIPGVGLEIEQYQLRDSMAIGQAVRTDLGIRQDAFVIICVAELNQNKNQSQLLEAVRLLHQQTGDVHCLLVGNGEEERTLKRLVTQSGLTDQVHFLGYRRDIPRLLAAADVCVLTSRREGLPRAIMEAMAAGKPIIGTAIRGIKDLVKHGENGFLVALDDVQETVQSLQMLYRDRHLCAQMGQRSKELIRQYELAGIVHQLAAIYQTGADGSDGQRTGDFGYLT